jgi:hypothetical protein
MAILEVHSLSKLFKRSKFRNLNKPSQGLTANFTKRKDAEIDFLLLRSTEFCINIINT